MIDNKEYNKVIKLTSKQANNILKQLAPKESKDVLKHTFEILTNRCVVQIDRSNPNAITIYSMYGISKILETDSQTCRLIIVAAITANNYAHFYSNLKKKLKRLPKKSSK